MTLDRHLHDRECALDPQPGDWWHDHYCPAYLVVAVEGDSVLVTREVITSSEGWRWPDSPDPLRCERLTHMPGKLWASCVRPKPRRTSQPATSQFWTFEEEP